MTRRLSRYNHRLRQATMVLASIGAVCLIGIVMLVSVGVFMRYVLGAPILGVNEIVELTAVALVMSSLPYCTARNEHVGVDVFDSMLGHWGRTFGDILSRVLSGLVLSILCLKAYDKALDAHEFGDATNMLQMPIWPFYAMIVAGCALCVIVFALQIVILLAGGRETPHMAGDAE